MAKGNNNIVIKRRSEISHKSKDSVAVQTVKSDPKIRKIIYVTSSGTYNISSLNIEYLAQYSKQVRNLFLLSIIEANKTAVFNGNLEKDQISFSLERLREFCGYKDIDSARSQFNKAKKGLYSLMISGENHSKGKKNAKRIASDRVLFTGSDMIDTQVTIYLNSNLDWSFLFNFYSKFPSYYGALSNNAQLLILLIMNLYRMKAQSDSLIEKGYFNISIKQVWEALNLPDAYIEEAEDENISDDENASSRRKKKLISDTKKLIRDPIDNAVLDIMDAQRIYEKQRDNLSSVADEDLDLRIEIMVNNTVVKAEEKYKFVEWFEHGYLRVYIKGEYTTEIKEIRNKEKKKIADAQKRRDKAIEKASVQKLLNASASEESAKNSTDQ